MLNTDTMKIRIVPIGLACALLLAGCKADEKKKTTAAPLKIHTEVISHTTSTYTHSYVGKIESAASIPLTMQSAGQVVQVYVRKGDRVKAGQEILRIDNTRAKDALQAADASLKEIEDGYGRAQKVFAEGGVTEQKMVELKTKLQQARSMVNMSKKSVEDCVLRAPSDGVIGDCDIHVGQVVSPVLPVATLLHTDGFNVVFDVAEQDVSHISVGDKGAIQIAALGQDTLPVRIVEKSLVANTIAHTYTLKAEVLASEAYKKALLPGMISKVWLNTQITSGYAVPTPCVQILQTGHSVWVVENGKAQRRAVEIGMHTQGRVLVTSGLQAGDTLIVEGQQKLYGGAAVEIE